MRYRDELKQKKRRKFLLKLTAILGTKIAVFFVVVYFLFFTNYLRVTDLKVESLDEEFNNILQNNIKDWLGQTYLGLKWHSNLLLLSTADLQGLLQNKFPVIADLKINKNFPHGLHIYATEKEHYGTWCLASRTPPRCFQFDLVGEAFKETSPSTGFLIFTVLDYRPRNIDIGQLAAEDNWFSTLFLVRENLLKQNIKIGEFIIPADSFDEFQVKIAEGWPILFSISTDTTRQIDALAQFLREREKDKNATRLEYVDLRVQDRIYFK